MKGYQFWLMFLMLFIMLSGILAELQRTRTLLDNMDVNLAWVNRHLIKIEVQK